MGKVDLTPDLVRRIAVAAHCDTRTVTRVLVEGRGHQVTRIAVVRAAREILGAGAVVVGVRLDEVVPGKAMGT